MSWGRCRAIDCGFAIIDTNYHFLRQDDRSIRLMISSVRKGLGCEGVVHGYMIAALITPSRPIFTGYIFYNHHPRLSDTIFCESLARILTVNVVKYSTGLTKIVNRPKLLDNCGCFHSHMWKDVLDVSYRRLACHQETQPDGGQEEHEVLGLQGSLWWEVEGQ